MDVLQQAMAFVSGGSVAAPVEPEAAQEAALEAESDAVETESPTEAAEATEATEAPTAAQDVAMIEIDGQQVSAEEAKDALLTHKNWKSWRAKQTQRDQELAAQRKEYDAKMEKLDAMLKRAGGEEDEAPEEDPQEKTLDDLAERLALRLGAPTKQQKQQQIEVDQDKAFQTLIDDTAKEYEVNPDTLFRTFVRNPSMELHEHALALRQAKRAPIAPPKPKTPAPAAAKAGGTMPAATTTSPGTRPKMDDPNFWKYAQKQVIASRQASAT